jgi:predicted DNA binding CopG/RHH family protein
MKKEYDFSKGKRNPYAKKLKRQVTMRIDEVTLRYFKALSKKMGIPYQTLINLYLRDCVIRERTLEMEWKSDESDD